MIIWKIVLLLATLVGLFAISVTLDQIANEITIIEVNDDIIRLALYYHGVEEAYYSQDSSEMYFNRGGYKCVLFTEDMMEWYTGLKEDEKNRLIKKTSFRGEEK